MDGSDSNMVYFRPRSGGLYQYVVEQSSICLTVKSWPSGFRENVADEIPSDKEQVIGLDEHGNVPSLFRQSIDLIARNIECVESLEGFPEDVAHVIWKSCVNIGKFTQDSETAASALRIFAEAYPESCLSSLHIGNIFLLNNYELSINALCCKLTKMDLTSCDLDDGHDLLPAIPTLTALEVLVLEGTPLSHEGLKRILLPCLNGKRLPKLAYVDLSRTNFNNKTLGYLAKMPQLKKLVVFQSDLPPNSSTASALKAGPLKDFRQKPRPDIEKVKDEGFAVVLIRAWEEATVNSMKKKPPKRKDLFYKKSPLVENFDINVSNSKLSYSNTDVLQKSKIMFERITKRSFDDPLKDLKQQQTLKRPKLENEQSINDSELLSLYM